MIFQPGEKKSVPLCVQTLFFLTVLCGADAAKITKKLQLQVVNSIGKYLRRRDSDGDSSGGDEAKTSNNSIRKLPLWSVALFSNVVSVGTTRRKELRNIIYGMPISLPKEGKVRPEEKVETRHLASIVPSHLWRR